MLENAHFWLLLADAVLHHPSVVRLVPWHSAAQHAIGLVVDYASALTHAWPEATLEQAELRVLRLLSEVVRRATAIATSVPLIIVTAHLCDSLQLLV